jgi:hypothetical protein
VLRRPRGHLATLPVLLLLAAGGCASADSLASGEDAGDATTEAPAWPEGVETYDEPSNLHVEGPVDYAVTPPPGGDHSPTWLNCGIYDEPVEDENAVHSLEHGAVWISYDPALPDDQVERLRGLVGSRGYVVLSPYEGQESPVVLTAWGVQLRLESADDERAERFLQEYVQGEQTPEPGAPCTGGTGTPQRVSTV